MSILIVVLAQIFYDSIILGAMLGFIVLSVTGQLAWSEQDSIFTDGMRMMVQICIIMTIASGFAGVLKSTGGIDSLVSSSVEWVSDHHSIATFLMLLTGLIITIGFGDSFASVPILAPIYLPICFESGFSLSASIIMLGASAALGDAGSPASTNKFLQATS
ncbi:MAG: Na+/H+ antiporter NhaC family protein [Endozoicomonas sp.]